MRIFPRARRGKTDVLFDGFPWLIENANETAYPGTHAGGAGAEP
jgi:hypothetical protein